MFVNKEMILEIVGKSTHGRFYLNHKIFDLQQILSAQRYTESSIFVTLSYVVFVAEIVLQILRVV